MMEIDPVTYANVSPHLEAGETVKWCGQPSLIQFFRQPSILFLFAGLPLLGALAAWSSQGNPMLKRFAAMSWREWFLLRPLSANNPGPISWHVAGFVVAVCGVAAIIFVIAERNEFSRTYYVVTNRRLLTICAGRKSVVVQVSLQDVATLTSRIGCSNGKIFLGDLPSDPLPRRVRVYMGGTVPVGPGVAWYVADARAVYEIIVGAAP